MRKPCASFFCTDRHGQRLAANSCSLDRAPGTRTPRHVLGTVRLRFVAPVGSANFFACIVVVVASWAQPVALLELHGGAVHVVARLPQLVIVIAANRAFPIPLLPLLLAIDRHRSHLHRYKYKFFRFDSVCVIGRKTRIERLEFTCVTPAVQCSVDAESVNDPTLRASWPHSACLCNLRGSMNLNSDI